MKPVTVVAQIEPDLSTLSDDCICRLTLADGALAIDRVEHNRPTVRLYCIPLHAIGELRQLNPEVNRVNPFRRLGEILQSMARGEQLDVDRPQLLLLTFRHPVEEESLTLRLLEGGAQRFVRRYRRLARA